MNINTLSKQTGQPIGWQDNNERIPEGHINDLVQCAMNMQSAMCMNINGSNIKPYKIWVPHRESELENVLGCVSLWAAGRCQDQTFTNAKTVLAYIIAEPDFVENNPVWYPHESGNFPNTKQIAQDWDTTKKLIYTNLVDEHRKKRDKKYNYKPDYINPFQDWHPNHIAQINLTVGMAASAVQLRARELGYWCQHYTAYTHTVQWHNQFKDKFHIKGKWFPFILQIIGTKPTAMKRSDNRAYSHDHEHLNAIMDPNDREQKQKVPLGIDQFKIYNIDGMENEQHNKGFGGMVNVPMTQSIPDYQIEFFMNNYGKYSENPRTLFGNAYNMTVADWETVYDDWMTRNSQGK